MAELLKVVILGIVEGITEFLPISSTGHLLIVASLLDFRSSLNSTFEIFIQLGAVFAVIAFYRADLLHQVKNVGTDARIRRLWLNVVFAFIPAGVVGFLLRDWIKTHLLDTPANPLIIAVALIVGGILFLLIERRPTRADPVTADLAEITTTQAVIVGVAQAIAIIPGVSRSGASIIGGMLGGLNRETATRFSFYLSIPTLGIATVFSLLTSLDEIRSGDLLLLLLGTLVSAVVAWFSIGWLLRFVSRNSYAPFGTYRIAAGMLILLFVLLRLFPT